MPLLKLLIVGAFSAPLVACSPTIRWPRLYGPGPAPYQRRLAEEFDPYPSPDLGPPLVGARPREFQIPRDEVRRSRQFLDSVGAKPQPFLPGMAVPLAAPIPTGPPIPVGAAPVVTPQVRY
jgi:hypothetical protein